MRARDPREAKGKVVCLALGMGVVRLFVEGDGADDVVTEDADASP